MFGAKATYNKSFLSIIFQYLLAQRRMRIKNHLNYYYYIFSAFVKIAEKVRACSTALLNVLCLNLKYHLTLILYKNFMTPV
jgi:hypothetical protein